MTRKLILSTAAILSLAATAAPAQKFVRPVKRPPEPVAQAGRVAMEAPVGDQVAVVDTAQAATPQQPAAPAAPAATTTVAQALPTLANRATLVRLATAADLTTELAGPGPFTVFAPSDEAFGRMPAGAIDTLLRPENKASLSTVLKYHVVAGSLSAEQIKAQITAGGGSATLTTLNGQTLTASLGENGNVMLTDVNGVKSYVEQADLAQANGVVHLTNGVSFPKLG
jgi:uncharacterized surface protein with fasciclin (FAS1) repeats